MGIPPWEELMNNVNKHLSENDLGKLHPASMQVEKRALHAPLQPHFWCPSVMEGEVELNVVQIIILTKRAWLHNSLAKHIDLSFCFEYCICFFEPVFQGKDLEWFWQDVKLSLKSRIISEVWQTNSILNELNEFNCPRTQIHLVNKSWKLLPLFQCPLPLQVIVFCFCYSFLQSAAVHGFTVDRGHQRSVRSCPRKRAE